MSTTTQKRAARLLAMVTHEHKATEPSAFRLLLLPALKNRPRELGARAIGRTSKRRLGPRTIHCRHLYFEADGIPRWVETESATPDARQVLVPVGLVAHTK